MQDDKRECVFTLRYIGFGLALSNKPFYQIRSYWFPSEKHLTQKDKSVGDKKRLIKPFKQSFSKAWANLQ